MFLANSGEFVDITPRPYYMPIGHWDRDRTRQRLGRAYRASCRRFSLALVPMLVGMGWSESILNEILANYHHDLQNIDGMVGVYHTVYARKREL
jgi:hypothetical protein